MKKFKNELSGERIVLKRTKPHLKTAIVMFGVIDKNREHLRKWLPWEKHTKRIEDTLEYLLEKEKSVKAGKKIEYGVYIDNKYAGNVGVFDIDPKTRSCEIGYWISTDFTKKGYMSEAVKVIEKELFENLNINRIQIRCDERNIASSGVAKKCGYFFEGKNRMDTYSDYFKDLRNTFVFSKLKKEFKKTNSKKHK